MSTVIGQCTDCIISLPPQPVTSLKFHINAQKGNGGIIKLLDSADAYYPANNIISEQRIQLAAAGTFAPQLPTALVAMCIFTSGPVTVTAQKGSATAILVVNKVLILDDAYTAISIENTGTATANIVVNYATV